MSYGHLTVICGPMFAGKTTELLKRILWATNGLGERTAVFKSGYDTRYGMTDIISHDGLKAQAAVIADWRGAGEATHVFFDEAQFFTAPYFNGDLVHIIHTLLQQGCAVTATGLDTDWRGHPFDITARLAAMADDVVKLQSHCSVCGRTATKTYRREPGPNAIALGGAETYEPRCNAHWSAHGLHDLFSAAGTEERGAHEPASHPV
jgi:thymidine kinase